MTTSQNDAAPMLDGLELETGGGRPDSPLRRAVVTTITALGEANLLEPRHAAMCQLALELADAVANGNGRGRASAAAMAAAQLRETLLALPEPTAAGLQESFDAWVRDMIENPR